MSGRTPAFDLINTGMNGELAQRLRTWREEGFTYDTISRRLGDEGYVVSRDMIRRWFLDIDSQAVEAS